jgi:hypothetical protein
MSNPPITQQPKSIEPIFELMPDEYIRFEYNYKPGCCCFSSKITTVTNMRLITRVIKTPTIFSSNTSTGKEKQKTIYLTDINNIQQLQSAIPSSQNNWWMKCIDVLTCTCSNQQIDWLESCRGIENLAMEKTESTIIQKSSLVEKF